MEKIFIGTALGGTLETVNNGLNGFLVPYNDKEKFAELLTNVMNMSEDEKNEIKKNARKNVLDNFTFDSFYDKLCNIYNEILGK